MNEISPKTEITGSIEELQNYGMNRKNATCLQDSTNGIFEFLAMTFGVAIFLTNLIVVIAIKKGGRRLRKARFYCISNLAVADMLAGLLLLWIFGLQRILLKSRPPYVELVTKCIWTLTIWTSLMSQVVIALDRYTHVRMGTGGGSPLFGCNTWGNRQRRRLIQIGIALTWIIPTIIYVVPVLTMWNCASECSCYTRDNNTEVIYMECHPSEYCSEVNPAFTKGSMLMLGLVLLLLPTMSFIFYWRIYCFVRNSSSNIRQPKSINHIMTGPYIESLKRRELGDVSNNCSKDDSCGGRSTPFLTPDQSNSTINQPTNTKNGFGYGKCWRSSEYQSRSLEIKRQKDEPSSRPSSIQRTTWGKRANGASRSPKYVMQQRHNNRDMKLLKTMIIILSLFVITTVPLGIVLTLSFLETDKQFMAATKYLLTFSLLNSLMNPWVYFWRFSEMRTALNRLLCFHRSREENSRQAPLANEASICCLLQPGKSSIFSSRQNSKKHTSSNSSNTF